MNKWRKEDESEELKSTEQGKSGTIERSVNVLYNPGILEKLCRLKKIKAVGTSIICLFLPNAPIVMGRVYSLVLVVW